MVSDSVSNVSHASIAKKKRTNRLAKLKQCKLDVRREQWLSQIKNKGCKMDPYGTTESPVSPIKIANNQKRSLDALETRSRGENEDVSIHGKILESFINRPQESSLSHNDSRNGLSGSSFSGSSTSSGYCSGSVSDEEEDGCLDNWEAVADALNADANQYEPASNTPTKLEAEAESADTKQLYTNQAVKLSNSESRERGCGSRVNCQAWRPDDASRPQNLPSLSKEPTFSVNSDRHYGRGDMAWAWQSMASLPSSCPICCEDLDVTDSSFLPCSCGFRLCLFCHKRILEADGRCPGCRKTYDAIYGNANTSFKGAAMSFQVACSCSVSSES